MRYLAPVDTVAKYRMAEDEAIVIDLDGQDGDGDVLHAYITELPSAGTLLNMDGTPGVAEPVVAGSLPARVAGLSIFFVGGQDANGAFMFKYALHDGYSMSAPAVVLIDIEPVNDAPVLHPPVSSLTTARHTPVAEAGAAVGYALVGAGSRCFCPRHVPRARYKKVVQRSGGPVWRWGPG